MGVQVGGKQVIKNVSEQVCGKQVREKYVSRCVVNMWERSV